MEDKKRKKDDKRKREASQKVNMFAHHLTAETNYTLKHFIKF